MERHCLHIVAVVQGRLLDVGRETGEPRMNLRHSHRQDWKKGDTPGVRGNGDARITVQRVDGNGGTWQGGVDLIDEDQPKQFADFIRAKDYGLSESIPADKKTLNKFRRFTGRAEGLSISFEQHLLGSKIEFDEAGGTLTLRGLPTQLTDQLKRAVS